MEVIYNLFLCIIFVKISEEKLLVISGYGTFICTPSKDEVCIAIRQCPYFNDLLNNSPIPRPRNVIAQIRDRQCGFKNKIPFVCCEKSTKTPEEDTIKTKLISTANRNAFTDPITNHPNYHLLPKDTCGTISTDSRITNGHTAGVIEYPWMALIFYNSSVFIPEGVIDFRCGGTVINDRYVLTAAHCIINSSIVGVRLGEYNVKSQVDCDEITGYCSPPIQDFLIEKIIVHPEYNTKTFSNDIALIKLKGPITFNNENIQPICLPIETPLSLRSGIVSGWGVTEDGYKTEVLMKVRIPILPLSHCNRLFQKSASLSNNQICAGGRKGRDSCGGDSGGPLQEVGDVNGVIRIMQYGIVSFGPKNCGTEGIPGVYTKVSSYMEWILDNLEDY
ncbi:phenoloxidase-activating factor 3-like isoform X1 [Diorhabda sublineata]|uniref:phenoloxidase-activating factor 3-like isoform X1 n=1 Tax=Diorhabda sublineata TaxID=1163346 RepID=UPI0024E0D80E|nr:phenoloxidase-activating factor 3-like isoform X1 [Diorhabda sublineata]